MNKNHATDYDFTQQSLDISAFTVGMQQLKIVSDDIVPLLGGRATAADELENLVSATLLEAREYVDCRVGYRTFTVSDVNVQPDGITVGGTRFRTGRLVPERIDDIGSMAAYVATAGVEAERWEEKAAQRSEYVKASVIRAIGMVAAERGADWLEHRMTQTFRRGGMGLTNRFDVGFCGWNPDDAPALLHLFPGGFCGLEIGRNRRIRPKATLAGIFGIGFRAVRREHPCYRCIYNIGCVRRRT